MAALLLSVSAFADVPRNILEVLKENVVQVHYGNKIGSAFFISPQYLVTNKHIISYNEDSKGDMLVQDDPILTISDARDAYLEVPRYAVRMYIYHHNYDLAILYCAMCPADSGKGLPVLEGLPEQGTTAWASGFGLGSYSVHEGLIQQTVIRPMPWTNISVPTASGDSGSPVVVLVDGVPTVAGVRTAVRLTRVVNTNEEQGVTLSQVAHKAVAIPSALLAGMIKGVFGKKEEFTGK